MFPSAVEGQVHKYDKKVAEGIKIVQSNVVFAIQPVGAIVGSSTCVVLKSN